VVLELSRQEGDSRVVPLGAVREMLQGEYGFKSIDSRPRAIHNKTTHAGLSNLSYLIDFRSPSKIHGYNSCHHRRGVHAKLQMLSSVINMHTSMLKS
jgi:hypothetical protein